MKTIFSKIFVPPVKVVIVTDLIAIPLTVISLAFLSSTNPVSLIAYLLLSFKAGIFKTNNRKDTKTDLTCMDQIKTDWQIIKEYL